MQLNKSCLAIGNRQTDGQTDRQTDICDSRVAFATEKVNITKVCSLIISLNPCVAFWSSVMNLHKFEGDFQSTFAFVVFCMKMILQNIHQCG